MKVAQISTGFIDVPGQISLNIFSQGCKKDCKGCQNPTARSFDGGREITLDMMGGILEVRKMAKWICWTGGDAVYQPKEFENFNKFFKSKGYKVALYTGCLLEDILSLLNDVDVVIDGPWIEENGPITSDTTNQRTWYKSNGEWKQVKFGDLKNVL